MRGTSRDDIRPCCSSLRTRKSLSATPLPNKKRWLSRVRSFHSIKNIRNRRLLSRRVQGKSRCKSHTISNMLDGIYKKVVFREGKIVGAVLFGDTSEAIKLSQMINEKKDLSQAEKVQLFPSQHEKENA